jgi:hypothetical protein
MNYLCKNLAKHFHIDAISIHYMNDKNLGKNYQWANIIDYFFIYVQVLTKIMNILTQDNRCTRRESKLNKTVKPYRYTNLFSVSSSHCM